MSSPPPAPSVPPPPAPPEKGPEPDHHPFDPVVCRICLQQNQWPPRPIELFDCQPVVVRCRLCTEYLCEQHAAAHFSVAAMGTNEECSYARDVRADRAAAGQ